MEDLKDLNPNSELNDLIQYEGHSDEQSDEEVIIELRAEERCYDDETTTTASGMVWSNSMYSECDVVTCQWHLIV